MLSGRNAFSENPGMIRIFRFIAVLALAALALTIAGGVISTADDPSRTSRILRQVGIIVFGVVYVLLAIAHVICWSYERLISRRGRNVRYGLAAL